ncbi:MAG TPA: HAD family phosphatase [Firmicutes bacterium]|nr:HAD family phosphatase [Bacillota bacterium]
MNSGASGYKLIATDIDGTLLDEKWQVTPRTKQVIEKVVASGRELVLCSGRPPRTIRRLWQELHLSTPVIAYNGSLIYDYQKEKPLFYLALDKQLVAHIIELIRRMDDTINLSIEAMDHWFIDRLNDSITEAYKSGFLYGALPSAGRLEGILPHLDLEISKLFFIAPPAVRRCFEDQLKASGLYEKVTVTSSGWNFVEVLPPGADKGRALRELCRLRGVSPEQTVFLGDEENDIPAFAVAGLSIAMGNASDRVKAAADLVTATYLEEGWAEAVERHVLAGSRLPTATDI